jgi:hypothetical protein
VRHVLARGAGLNFRTGHALGGVTVVEVVRDAARVTHGASVFLGDTRKPWFQPQRANPFARASRVDHGKKRLGSAGRAVLRAFTRRRRHAVLG